MAVPRQAIVDRLTENVENLLTTYGGIGAGFAIEVSDPFQSTGRSGGASPFVRSLFPEIKVAATLERSLNTALGWGWDKIAAMIARETYGNGEHDYVVTGSIPAVTATAIESIINAYRDSPRRQPDTPTELEAILPSVGLAGPSEAVSEKDDAYFVTPDGVEHHVEIKTPKPNYDQMRAAKRRILRISAVRHPTPVRAFVGMPYNPNGRYGPYGWPVTSIYLDMSVDLLVGSDFWNYIGNSSETYDELLDCFYEVGATHRADLIRLLAGES